jgi:hypothetical protein
MIDEMPVFPVMYIPFLAPATIVNFPKEAVVPNAHAAAADSVARPSGRD